MENPKFRHAITWVPDDVWRDFQVICDYEGCNRAWKLADLITEYVKSKKEVIEQWRKQTEKGKGELKDEPRQETVTITTKPEST
jgi:hypothetical protein